jgi:hypothetical protein
MSVEGVTILALDDLDPLAKVAIHHRPVAAVLAFSAEMGNRLATSPGPTTSIKVRSMHPNECSTCWCAARSSTANGRSPASRAASSAASAGPTSGRCSAGSRPAPPTSRSALWSGRRRPVRFTQLDLDVALTLDPQAQGQAGRRLVRLIASNPVTMYQMRRHVPDAAACAPVTPSSGRYRRRNPSRLRHGRRRNCALARCGPSQVAEQLDSEVLGLLRHVSGCRHPECSEPPRATVPIC